MFSEEEVLNFANYDLHEVVTPVKADILEELLTEANYPQADIEFLVNGFRNGFDLKYQGPEKRRDTAPNIPIKIGSHIEMWNKIMKEVKLK